MNPPIVEDLAEGTLAVDSLQRSWWWGLDAVREAKADEQRWAEMSKFLEELFPPG